MELRDNMGRDNFADTLSGRRTSVNSTTNGRDVATYDRSHETGIDLFPTDEANVSRFHHCVGGFNHRHQTTTFDHSQCFCHSGHDSTKKCRKKAQNA